MRSGFGVADAPKQDSRRKMRNVMAHIRRVCVQESDACEVTSNFVGFQKERDLIQVIQTFDFCMRSIVRARGTGEQFPA